MTVIMHIFGTMDRGGAELRTLELAERIPGCRHVYIVLSGRPGEMAPQIERRGDVVVSCRIDAFFLGRFLRAVRHYRPTVVHSNVATFSGVILALAALAGVRNRIAHFRSTGDEHGDNLRRRLQRSLFSCLISRFATRIIGVSPGALTHGWRGDWTSDSRASVVPDGVPLQQPDPFPPPRQELVIAHVGKPLPSKRRTFAIEVLHAVRSLGIDARLQMVGPTESSEKASLTTLAENLGVGSALTFLGVRSDVVDLLRASDLLLATSDREGLPGVVLEALSVGCPAVAARIPGVEYIAEYCDGVAVVDPHDAAAIWAGTVAATAAANATEERRSIWRTFTRSPFTVDEAARAMADLWRAPA